MRTVSSRVSPWLIGFALSYTVAVRTQTLAALAHTVPSRARLQDALAWQGGWFEVLAFMLKL